MLVPIAAAPPPSAPRRAPAAAASAGGGTVVPFRRGSIQLVRPLIGGQDPYADFLDKIPDIQPGAYGAHVAAGLVPNEEEIAGLAEMAPAVAADPHTQAHEDPALDAFGGRGVKSTGVKPLGEGGGTSA